VETYISGPALEKRYYELTGKSKPLKGIAKSPPAEWKVEFLEGDGILNLTGGTMTFGGQTFFTSDGGVVNVSNDGQLIFTDQDIVSTLQGYVDTKITGITTDLIVYVGEDTIVNYHRKGTVVSVK